MVTPILKPVAKTLIKAGIGAYETGRVAFAEMSERTTDVLAEARSEMDAEQRGPRPAAKPTDGGNKPSGETAKA